MYIVTSFERIRCSSVVGKWVYDQTKVIPSHQKLQPKPIGFDLIKAILT